MRVSFHLTDSCDLKCIDCHWFSSPVIYNESVNYLDYLGWLSRNHINYIRLTGGEPFLYPQLNKLLKNLPDRITIDLFTNGNNVHLLESNLNKKISFKVSVNRETESDFQDKVKNILSEYDISFFSFIKKEGCYHLPNQMKEQEKYSYLLGKMVYCLPTLSRFGTDGCEYYCERGLRSKSNSLKTGNTLWNTYHSIKPKLCQVTKECLSCFVGEQKFTIIN